MSRVRPHQTNFASGELTDALDGRSDLDRYYNGCRTMLNWQPVVQGGVRRSPGTVFVAVLDGRTRLQAFHAGAGAANRYLLALGIDGFGVGYLDIYCQGTKIQTITGAPWVEANLFELDITSALDTVILTAETTPTQRLYRDSGGTFHLENLFDTNNEIHFVNIPTTIPLARWYPAIYRFLGDHAQTIAGNGMYYECTTEGMSGDTEPAWPTLIGATVVDGAATWTCKGLRAELEVWGSGTYLPVWQAGKFRFDGALNRPATPDGFFYRASEGGFTGGMEPEWPGEPVGEGSFLTDGTVTWVQGGPLLDQGYPRCCTFFEDRLVLAGTTAYPHRRWLSKSGDYFNFDLGVAVDDDAIDRDLLADELPTIQWVHGSRKLLFGTSMGEFAVLQDGPVTPSAMNTALQTNVGSARVSPVAVDGAVLHVTESRKQLRELLYSDVEQAFSSKSLSLLSSAAITEAVQLAAKASVDHDDANLVYVVNASGTVGVMSVLRNQELLAWSRRTFAGTVESIATMDGKVYASVKVDATTRHLVYFDDEATMDSQGSFTTEGPPGTVWYAFPHLAGREIQVVADGIYHGTQTFAPGGAIRIPTPAKTLTAGLAIPTPTLTLMPVAVAKSGSVAGALKRLLRVFLQLQDTASLYVDGNPVPIREAQHDTSAAIVPFTGTKLVSCLGRDREATITITAPDPLPATVLSITREVSF